MPNNNSGAISPYDRSSVSEIIESHVESIDEPEEGVEELSEWIEELFQTIIDLTERRERHFRENAVHTVAVERVLLEYGISVEHVDEIIETIETVDDELWGDDDE